MAKKHTTQKRRYIKHNRKREFHAAPHAENYFKKQAETINSLKPVMAAAKRFRERRSELTPATSYSESE